MSTSVLRVLGNLWPPRPGIITLFLFGILLLGPLGKFLPTALSPTANRRLYFKLPIEDAEFHWEFLDSKAFLSGELTLRIVNPRRGRDQSFVVFKNGTISEGWHMIGSTRDSSFYFGFATDTRSPTAPDDSLIITLVAPHELRGRGPYTEGTLAAGTWQATGTYSHLWGGTLNPFNAVTRAFKAPLATMQCWDTVWPVTITKNEGWTGIELAADEHEESWMDRAIGSRGTDGRQCVSHR